MTVTPVNNAPVCLFWVNSQNSQLTDFERCCDLPLKFSYRRVNRSENNYITFKIYSCKPVKVNSITDGKHKNLCILLKRKFVDHFCMSSLV